MATQDGGARWRRKEAAQGRDTRLRRRRKKYKSQQALLPDRVNESSLVYRQKASRSDTATWRIREKEV